MIIKRIYDWARTQPHKTAVIHNDVSLTYAVFARALDASCRFFEVQNLPAGKTAVVLINSLMDSWVITLGMRAIGLNTICVQSLAQIETLQIRNVACIVTTQFEFDSHKIDSSSLTSARFIMVPTALFGGIHTGDIPIAPPEKDLFGGHILYTSGTTGVHKKLFLTDTREEKRKLIETHRGSQTVFHAVDFKMWTAAGFRYAPVIWNLGGTIIFDQRAEKYEHFFRHKPTHAVLVPLMLKQLLAAKNIAKPAPGEFELGTGGGFIPLSVAEDIIRRLTDDFTIMYGASECAVFMYSKFKDKDDIFWLTPSPDHQIEIVNEAGNLCDIEEEGELRLLLGELDCTSYMDDEEASREVFRDGYFYPGDLAVRRADGRIRILGRTKDVLNFHGEKLAVAPIEEKFQRSLGVEEVCLFSRLNDDGEEDLVVAILADQPPPQMELNKIASQSKSFQHVHFVILKEFPRTDTEMQKTNRKELKRIAFEMAEKAA